jgi:hypothetical protein
MWSILLVSEELSAYKQEIFEGNADIIRVKSCGTYINQVY